MNIIEEIYSWNHHPGIRSKTNHLILHHAAANGSAQDIHSYHKNNGWAGIAYHFYIRKSGSVHRGRPEDWRGGHTSGYEDNSLGICFEGNFENETMSAAQIKAGRELVNDICKRYPGIDIGPHRAYNATACPGKHFPYDELVAAPQDDEAVREPIYKHIDDIPEWGLPTVQKLVDAKALLGDAEGLNIPYSMLRVLVILGRMGAYENGQ